MAITGRGFPQSTSRRAFRAAQRYGDDYLGRQVWEADNSTGLYQPGSITTNHAQTSDFAAARYDATDVEIEFYMTVLDSFTHASVLHLIAAKLDTLNVNAGGWYIAIGLPGGIRFVWGTGSGNVIVDSGAGSLSAVTQLGRKTGYKFTLDKDNGSGVYAATWWYDLLDGAGWRPLASALGGTTATIASVTNAFRLGGDIYGNNNPHRTVMHSFTMRDGIGGTAFYNHDFENRVKWPNGATSGTDTVGSRTLSLSSSPSINQHGGNAIVTVAGSQATETDTANVGGIALGASKPAWERDNLGALYTNATGDPYSNAYTPDTAALDIVGDIDLRAFEVAPRVVATGAAQTILSKWIDLGFNERAYLFRITSTGALIFNWSTTGTDSLSATSTVTLGSVGARDGEPISVRVTFDVDNGASGRTATFYYSFDLGMSPTWTQLGSPVTTGTVTSINNAATRFMFSGYNNGTTSPGFNTPFIGTIRGGQVRDGIDGTLVFSTDFGDQTKWRAGQTSGTDTTTGKVITIQNAAIYQNAGAAVVVVQGSQAQGTATANAGAPAVAWPGKMAADANDQAGMRIKTAGSGLGGATTPDHASLEIAGDIDIRVKLSMPNWRQTDGGTLVDRTNFLSSTAGGYGIRVALLDPVGRFAIRWNDGSTNMSLTTTNPLPAAITVNGAAIALRATLDVDNGSGQHVGTFYYSTDYEPVGDTGSWTQIEQVTGSGTTSIAPSTSGLQVGESIFATDQPVGIYEWAQVRDGINGTIVANPDFRTPLHGASGAATLVDSAGRSWNVDADSPIQSNRGVPIVTVAGSQAQETDTGRTGAVVVATAGRQAYDGSNPYGVRLYNNTNSYTQTPDTSSLRYTATDMEGEIWFTVLDSFLHASETQMLVVKMDTVNAHLGGWSLQLTTSGLVQLTWGDGSVHRIATSTVSLPFWFVLNQPMKLKWALDRDGSGSAYTVRFDVAGPPGGYTQLGTTITGGATTSIASNTNNMRIGRDVYGNNGPHDIIVQRLILRDATGGGGTTLFDADFTDHTAWPNGATSGTDSTGKTVNLGSAASIYQNHGKVGIGYVGSQATETDTAFGGSAVVTVTGSQATETDEGRAGAAVVTVTGQRATETDTAFTGTPAVVYGGAQATETDTGRGGAANVTVQGSRADETDTAFHSEIVFGQRADETDTAFGGTPAVAWAGQRADETDTSIPTGEAIVVVVGNRATETDTGNTGTPAIVVQGSRADETDTAFAGSAQQEGGDVTINGSRADETDTGRAGSAAITVQGSQALEDDEFFEGSTDLSAQGSLAEEFDEAFMGEMVPEGHQAEETDTGNSGSAVIVIAGEDATTLDEAFSGSVLLTVQGSRADETDEGRAGAPAITIQGSRADEVDTGFHGTGGGDQTVNGAQASETDTGRAGSISWVLPGTRADEFDEPQAGQVWVGVIYNGTRATESDTGSHGSSPISVVGSTAVETDEGRAGASSIGEVYNGSQASELNEAFFGIINVSYAGGRANEGDIGRHGTEIGGEDTLPSLIYWRHYSVDARRRYTVNARVTYDLEREGAMV